MVSQRKMLLLKSQLVYISIINELLEASYLKAFFLRAGVVIGGLVVVTGGDTVEPDRIEEL